MKNVVTLTMALLAVVASASAQTSLAAGNDFAYLVSPVIVQTTQTASTKITLAPGLRMRNVGRTLTLIGGVLFVGGIAVVSQADATYYNSTTSSQYGNSTEGDPNFAIGVLMISGGVGMVVPGIIFWSKGQKRYNRWLMEEQKQKMSFGIQRSGLGLSYRF
jgi:hypothetical protein